MPSMGRTTRAVRVRAAVLAGRSEVSEPALTQRPGLMCDLSGHRLVEAGLPRGLPQGRLGPAEQCNRCPGRAGREFRGSLHEVLVGMTRPREPDLGGAAPVD